MTEPSLPELEAERDRLYAEVAEVGDFRGGPVSENYRKCGKPNWACAQPDHPGHRTITEFSRKIHDKRLRGRTSQTMNDLAADMNPVVAGWLAYFTAFYSIAVIPLCERIDSQLVRLAGRKYERIKDSDRKARAWLNGIRARDPNLFAHWKLCY